MTNTSDSKENRQSKELLREQNPEQSRKNSREGASPSASHAASEMSRTPSDRAESPEKPKKTEKSGRTKGGLKRFKKPSGFLYFIAYIIMGPYLKFKLKTTYDKSGLADIKGPAFLVCPHTSNIDFFFPAIALYPNKLTFVVSEHFMANPKTRWILQKMQVISKKMFCPDIKTIMNILRARDAGQIIVIYPEGRLSCVGHSLRVTDGTADLIKKLGVNVYCLCQNGAYKTLPKWGKAGTRPGRIHVTTKKLLDASEIPEMSAESIHALLEREILHDEEKHFPEVTYKCKAPAKGLDGVLYKCPECLAEFETETDDTHISCKACGFKAELTQQYKLMGAPFETINQWYFWQAEQLDISEPLDEQVKLGTPGKDGFMDLTAGRGRLYMDKDIIKFDGVCFGEPLEFTEKTSDIKGFPASVGHHIDIFHKKVLYYMMPDPDGRRAIKWMMYLDKITDCERENVSENNIHVD